MTFRGGSEGKASACNAGDLGSIPGSGRSPGEGNGNPLQYSCLGESHGLRSLVDYSPLGPKKSDTTEQCQFHFSDCGLPGFSVREDVLQARVLEWAAIAFSTRWASGKEPTCQCRRHKRHGFDPLGWEDSPGEGHGNPFRYSCLENPMNRGAWWAIIQGVAKSQM